MSFRDYQSGQLFININGVLPSELALVEPVEKDDLEFLLFPDKLQSLVDSAKQRKWNWKTTNIYRRRDENSSLDAYRRK